MFNEISAAEYAASTGPCQPGESEFLELARRYNLVTVYCAVGADTETPVSAFLKLGKGRFSFLLESAEGGERWGRYSFIGCEPRSVVRYRRGVLDFPLGEEGAREGVDPVAFLFDRIESYRTCGNAYGLPFTGGAVGYFSYDLLPFMDQVELHAGGGLGTPEMMFVFTAKSAAFDHFAGRIILMANVEIPSGVRGDGLRGLYREAVAALESMAESLRGGASSMPFPEAGFPEEKSGFGGVTSSTTCGFRDPCAASVHGDKDFGGVTSNFTREEYERMVESAREYIYAGEAFQIVPSQRFSTPLRCSPFSIYRSLRSENPSPYMFYLRFNDLALIGSSPEPLVRQRGGTAVIRPIAGTRPRGMTPQEDLALEEDLRSDPKERAEHLMLVDLARNDLGRVCLPGTVRVTRMMEVERFSHVMHLVSEVSGELRPGLGNRDLLRSSFPAGTVSGAPKVRACQLIDRLEKERRGPYAGAVGYISYGGDMDTCIAIRTIVSCGDTVHVQAGGGVVADSDPGREYEETLNKARALLRAVRLAEAREGVRA